MRDDYVTVWDGTHASASGTKYLVLDEDEARSPTPVVRRSYAREIRELLSDGRAKTVRELAEAMGCVASELYPPLWNLERTGAVTVSRGVGSHACSTTETKWYRLAEGGQ